MSSYNLYSEEHRPRPETSVKYYQPNSGWSRPDRVTTTREYYNFTVDFVHSKSDRVDSHERYKEVTKSRFGSLFHIPEPISVLHPILSYYDRWISNPDNDEDFELIPEGFLGHTLVTKIREEGERSHLTVLLHQSGEEGETLKDKGYIEVLFTQEYEWEKSKRNRFIFDLNGQCIEGQCEFSGTSISTNEGSNTPLSVLDVHRTKTEKLRDLLRDWYISEYDFDEYWVDELTPSEYTKIYDYVEVCNQVLVDINSQLGEDTYTTFRKNLGSNIERVIKEVIYD